jgi:alpha-glucoside transport system substrate-binding protein
MKRIKWFALLAVFALLVAACGDDDDAASTTEGTTATTTATTSGGGSSEGAQVTILGPETGPEAEGFLAGFEPLTERTGIEIVYTGTRDATTELNLALEAGAPPDIVIIPQPGRTVQFAESGDAVALPQDIVDTVASDYDGYWAELVTSGGNVYGVPNKGDVKSLVWYNPAKFEEFGYEVPTTWAEMETLIDQMKADGNVPFGIGLGSGDATGWPFTDWVEDFMLRLKGPDVYDQWVTHEIPFNDPAVKDVVEFVSNIWFTEGNVLGGRDTIATQGFKESGLCVYDGSCMMHRQANFYASNYVELGATVGPGGDVDLFYLPTITDEFGTVVLGAGTHAVAFTDKAETMEVMRYIASAEYANTRIMADKGGFLSPNKTHDTSLYSADLDRTLAEILVSADPFRFDASDLMPGEVGSGSFWREGTDYVSGAIDLDTMLDNIEASWP